MSRILGSVSLRDRIELGLAAGELASVALFLHIFTAPSGRIGAFLGLFAAGLVATRAWFSRRFADASPSSAARFLRAPLLFRALSWAIAAVPLAGSTPYAIVAAAYFGLIAGMGRGVAYRLLIDRDLDGEPPGVRLEYQKATLFERLVLSVDALGMLAGHALMLFALTFLDVGRGQIREAWIGLPPMAGTLLALRWLVTARLVGQLLDPDRKGGQAFRLARAIPAILAICHLVSWVVSGVIGLLVWGFRLSLRVDDRVIILALALLLVWGVILYQMRWHRAVMAPIEATMTPPAGSARSAQSLRVRMLVMFGFPVLFACALSLFASVTQYRQLATALVEREAKDRAAPIARRLGRQGADIVDMRRTFLEIDPPVGMVIFVVTRSGDVWRVGAPAADFLQFPRQHVEAPALAPRIIRAMRRGGRGRIEQERPLMTGAYLPIPAPPEAEGADREGGRGASPGTVAVLLPGYRGAGRVGHIVGLAVFFVALAIVASGVVVWASQELAVPVRRLGQAADSIASGGLGSVVPQVAEPMELSQLSTSLERMRRVLVEKIETIEELNVGLEAKVAERTGALQRANSELQDTLEKLKSAQAQLVHSEKMASLGQVVAGVAHEINNPLNFILNTLSPLSAALDEIDRVLDAYEALERCTELPTPGPALRAAREELAKERARIGLDETRAELRKMVTVMRTGAERAVRIVAGLRTFARAEGGDPAPFDLEQGLEESLSLVAHLLRGGGIEVVRDYAGLPPVRCRGGEVDQVFLNLITNAIQSGATRITLRTRIVDQAAVISVIDDGSGIAESALPRIFDPFYTTKPVGSGTGLGLSISLGIIRAQGGAIDVESQPGKGTELRVTLPLG